MEEQSTQPVPDDRSEDLFVSNHAMVVSIRGSFSDGQLRAALDRLRSRHIALIPGLEADDPLGSHFPLRVVADSQDEAWKDVVKEELLKPFPPEIGPFARLCLMRQGTCSDLVAIFHHGVCDGMSGVYFIRDLLQLLADPALALPSLPPPPRTQALIPEAVRNNPRVKIKVRLFLAGFRISLFFLRLRRSLFPAAGSNQAQKTSPASRRFNLLTETLTAGQTARLADLCKAEGTTVHAAICTAWLRAFAARVEGPKSRIRSVSSPVSLRERLSIPETSGLYLATVLTQINCAPERDFWQVAREFKRKLNQATTDEHAFLFPLMIGAVFSHFSGEAMKEILPSLFGRPVKYDFSVTNLGRLPIPVDIGDLHVEAFYNLVNTSEHERTVCVNTFGGQLRITLLLRESKMEPGQARELLRQATGQILAAIGPV